MEQTVGQVHGERVSCQEQSTNFLARLRVRQHQGTLLASGHQLFKVLAKCQGLPALTTCATCFPPSTKFAISVRVRVFAKLRTTVTLFL